MREITYQRAASVDDAMRIKPDAAFLGGGSSLIDLMKLEVLNPSGLVDVTDWSRKVVNSLVHAPHSPTLGRRIWPEF